MATKKKLNIFNDMILNLVATGIPVAVLQLIIYPILSRTLSVEDYAMMLALYSLWMLVSNTLGNCILNVRLIKNNLYEKRQVQGDFLNILARYAFVNLLIISIVSIIYLKTFDAFSLVMSILISLAIFLKAYLDVGFRIQINYKFIALAGLIIGLGYVAGYFLSFTSGRFEYVFLCAYLPACLFVALKTKLLHEKRAKTEMYRETLKDCNTLTLSCVISNLMVYADKLVLLPLLGAHSLAIYYNSTLLIKIVGLLTGPVSSVILTYVSKWEKDKDNVFVKMLYLGMAVLFVGYILIMLVARPVFGILYPMWVDEIIKYIPITTINMCLITLVAMLNPFVLKFRNINWQVRIGLISSVVYFVSALVLQHYFGLMGFCFGTVIGSAARVGLLVYAYYSNRGARTVEKAVG